MKRSMIAAVGVCALTLVSVASASNSACPGKDGKQPGVLTACPEKNPPKPSVVAACPGKEAKKPSVA